MAFTFTNNTANYLSQAASFDYNANYTMMAWVKWSALTTLDGIIEPSDGTTGNRDRWMLGSATASLMAMRVTVAGGTTTITGGTTLSTGVWYHVCAVRSGAALMQMYLNGATEGGNNAKDVSARAASSVLRVAVEIGGTNPMQGAVAHVKIWQAALSVDQIVNEMRSIKPQVLTGIWAWYPMFSEANNRAKDFSGNGRDWTINGTLNDESNPPVGWIEPKPYFLYLPVTSQTINANLIATAETFYNATVTPGSVTVSANFIASSETFFDAAVTPGSVTVSANAIASDETFFNATVTPGSVSVSANFIASSETFYDATVSPGSVTVSANFIASTETLYNATVTPGSFQVSANFISSDETFYDATVSLDGAISANFIGSSETVYQASVTPGSVSVSANFIVSAEAFYNATIQISDITFQGNFIASAEAVYSATVTPGSVTVQSDFIQSSEAFYSAEVRYQLETGFIPSEEAFYPATVTVGDVTLQAPFIGSLEAIYPASISGGALVIGTVSVSIGDAGSTSVSIQELGSLTSFDLGERGSVDINIRPGE